MTNAVIREDFREILRLVRPGSRVLDVGCGEGALLDLLAHEKQVDARGLELSAEGVAACMARGLSVVQGDADLDLDTHRFAHRHAYIQQNQDQFAHVNIDFDPFTHLDLDTHLDTDFDALDH